MMNESVVVSRKGEEGATVAVSGTGTGSIGNLLWIRLRCQLLQARISMGNRDKPDRDCGVVVFAKDQLDCAYCRGLPEPYFLPYGSFDCSISYSRLKVTNCLCHQQLQRPSAKMQKCSSDTRCTAELRCWVAFCSAPCWEPWRLRVHPSSRRVAGRQLL